MMKMKKLIINLVILLLVNSHSCKKTEIKELEGSIKAANELKEKILIIDVDEKTHKYMGKDNKFRKGLIELADKIKIYNPSIIFYNISFIKNLGGEAAFAKEINRGEPIISRFDINNDKKEKNFTSEIKETLPDIVKGYTKGDYDHSFTFTGINFPSIEIVKRSRALCSYVVFSYEENENDIVTPFNQYGNFLFESCPVTIANKLLSPIGLLILFNKREGKFFLHSLWDKSFGFVKFLGESDDSKPFRLHIKYKDFKKINGIEFLEKENMDIPKGFIFIVNVSDGKYKTSEGKDRLETEILASELYTLLDAVSKIRL